MRSIKLWSEKELTGVLDIKHSSKLGQTVAVGWHSASQTITELPH
jgi:hypothetical protein